MVLSFSRTVLGAAVALVIVSGAVPARAAARELATAQGTVDISEARPGLRAPLCNEMLVEARDTLDNHLIAETQPTRDDAGVCRYSLTVPAQTGVWLRLQPALTAGARVINGANVGSVGSGRVPSSSGSVALRFTIVATMTFFFTPNEQKTVPLRY